MDCFTPVTPALTLSELARKLRQPVSSTHRQIHELAEWGALERDESGRYSIGLHLWEIGALAPRRTDLREAAMPFLEDLYEVTHENVQVAVLDGDEVVCVERLFGHDTASVLAYPGLRVPAVVTGVGRVLLAFAGTERLNEVLSAPARRYPGNTVVDLRQLRRELATIRKTGYAVTSREVLQPATSVAAAVLGKSNTVVAALSVIVATGEETARGLVPAVLTAARGISRALGAPLTSRPARSPST